MLIRRQGCHYDYSRNLCPIRWHDLSQASTTSQSPGIRFWLGRSIIRQPKFNQLCQDNRSHHRTRVYKSTRGSSASEPWSSSLCSRPQANDRPRGHSSKCSRESTTKQPATDRATEQRCLQGSMGLYKSRHAFLRCYPHYMDSIQRQQNVLTHPSGPG